MPTLNKLFGLPAPVASAICGDVAAALTATGTNQATGLAIYANHNVFSTVAASTAAVLPLPTGVPVVSVNVGDSIRVSNHGANSLSVFPGVGSQIGTAAANAAFAVAANKTAEFVLISATQWSAILSA